VERSGVDHATTLCEAAFFRYPTSPSTCASGYLNCVVRFSRIRLRTIPDSPVAILPTPTRGNHPGPPGKPATEGSGGRPDRVRTIPARPTAGGGDRPRHAACRLPSVGCLPRRFWALRVRLPAAHPRCARV
jgi:hypothetical protein